MDIQCPSCQKKLQVEDQFAGQLIKCPACTGVFMAPTLVTPPPPVMAAPPPVPDVIPMLPPPPAPEVKVSAPKSVPEPEATFEPAASTPLPPGEFTKTHTCKLCPDALRWVMPAAVLLLFAVSFLTWVVRFEAAATATIVTPDKVGEKEPVPYAKATAKLDRTNSSLWSLAFGDRGSWNWIFYVLLTFFVALPLALARLLLDMKIVPLPDFLKPFWSFRIVAIGGILTFTLLLGLMARMQVAAEEATALGIFLGLRIHLVAVIAIWLENWLDTRKKTNLPLPELVARC